jgi:hypothetical protein
MNTLEVLLKKYPERSWDRIWKKRSMDSKFTLECIEEDTGSYKNTDHLTDWEVVSLRKLNNKK